ncbi:hypothetical protein UFOVP257_391 [uncultured Caudovirales phage]|uniref:Uncharacterized protein n=1 Tax=uncultured Caudovirales phage TaxID=2100421 RepID=A0A6J5LPP5_9CAUD|nr:hypothetical protein UFOVP257_391 [uncultured Caudovirales phage]
MKHVGVAVGMNMIDRIDQVRELANFFGFMLGHRPHHAFGDNIDVIALYPKDNSLPTYSRDACLFAGNLSDVENFLDGIRWARNYDKTIGATTDQRRKQFEDKEVARLAKIQYNKEKAETFKIIKQEHA